MALADVLEIRAPSEIGAFKFLNVWHVLRSSSSFDATKIANSFVDTVLSDILPLLTSSVEYTAVNVKNLGDAEDFVELPLTAKVGTRAGTNDPFFNVFTLRFPRLRTDMRDGRKRIGPTQEEAHSGNNLAAAYITDMDTLGTSMIGAWEETASPGVTVCRYIIVKRVCDAFDAAGKCTKYRLPETDGELIFYQPISRVSESTVRSQTSRKVL